MLASLFEHTSKNPILSLRFPFLNQTESRRAPHIQHTGGLCPREATRVVFPNGEVDPWHWEGCLVSPRPSVDTIFVKGGSPKCWGCFFLGGVCVLCVFSLFSSSWFSFLSCFCFPLLFFSFEGTAFNGSLKGTRILSKPFDKSNIQCACVLCPWCVQRAEILFERAIHQPKNLSSRSGDLPTKWALNQSSTRFLC